MNKEIVKKIIKPLNYMNKLIRKDSNKILIYSNLGFRDNVKSIYNYLIENQYNAKYKIICSVDDYELYKNIKHKNVKFVGNYWGLPHYLTSKYCFYSFGKYPIKPSKKQIVVNLWHGMPLKRIGNMETENKYVDFNFFSYVLSTSPFFSTFMMKAFNCSNDQILLSGQPRNDDLFSCNNVKEMLNIDEFKKKIVWLPTFRKSTRLNLSNQSSEANTELSFPIISDSSKMSTMNKILVTSNSILLIKPHPMQDICDNDLKHYSNIKVINQQTLENKSITLYSLLKESDALITDYSSVYFDYLLVNKPIGFTINDIEDYRVSRGFIVDEPLELMPGEKISDFESFSRFIHNVINENDEYITERKKINDLCNIYKDGNSSQRVLEFCGITKD